MRILDLPHALGHLAAAARATFAADSLTLGAWLDEQAHTLKRQGPDAVLAAVRALPAADAPDPAAAVDAREATLGYLDARRPMLRYPDFIAQGYPIGSGAIESACKLVVEARLKGGGMHWERANVSPMLTLRASLCSDRWAQDWPTILAQLRRDDGERRRLRLLARRPPAVSPPRAPAKPSPRPLHPSRALARLRAQQAPKIVAGKPTADHPWRRPLRAGRPQQQAS